MSHSNIQSKYNLHLPRLLRAAIQLIAYIPWWGWIGLVMYWGNVRATEVMSVSIVGSACWVLGGAGELSYLEYSLVQYLLTQPVLSTNITNVDYLLQYGTIFIMSRSIVLSKTLKKIEFGSGSRPVFYCSITYSLQYLTTASSKRGFSTPTDTRIQRSQGIRDWKPGNGNMTRSRILSSTTRMDGEDRGHLTLLKPTTYLTKRFM